jgi:hypothetical protein
MKIKLVAFAAAFAILLLFPPSAAIADATENPVIPPTEPIQVTLFKQEPETYGLELEGDLSSLQLESTVKARIGNSFSFVPGTVTWHDEAFNASVVGSQTLFGDVSLPTGYVFSEEPTVEAHIVVYDPNGEPPETAQGGGLMYITDRVVPLDMPAEALEQRIQDSVLYEAEFFLKNGWLVRCGILSWDASKVKTGEVGAYNPFKVDLPPYLSLGGKDNEDMLLALYVLDPEKVDLSAFVRDWNFVIECSWLKEIAEPELWVWVDDEIYPTEVTEENYCKFVGGQNSYTGLSIREDWLEPGHKYEFQVLYKDESKEDGGRSVNTLRLDTRGGDRLVCPVIGGDRFGKDRDQEEPPPLGSPRGSSNSGASGGAQGGGQDGGQTEPVNHNSSSVTQGEDPASSAEDTVRSGLSGDSGVPATALAGSVLQSVRQAVDGSQETKPMPTVPVPAALSSEPLRGGSPEPAALGAAPGGAAASGTQASEPENRAPPGPPVLPFVFAGIAAAALLVRAWIRARKVGGSA